MTMTDDHTSDEMEQPVGPSAGDGPTVIERVRLLPGGPELLALAREYAGSVELVGGAVRDMMLARSPRELDVVVAGDAQAFAEALALRLGALAGEGSEEHREVSFHERFGTALVRWSSGEIDIATRRTETYSSPGALPDVAPGTPEQDLERRDFTVNAIAVALAGERPGQLRTVEGALEDLAAGRLRVLQDASFLEDPTRILRLARYATRLGFEVEPHTAALAAEALAGGALKTVSGQRLGAELKLALEEPDPVAALGELARGGVFDAWEQGVSFDERAARMALEILPEDGSTRLLLVASLVLDLAQRLDREGSESAILGFLHDLELPAGNWASVFDIAVSAAYAIDHVDCADTLEDLLEVTEQAPVESLALAGAVRELLDGPTSRGRQVVEEWLGHQRHIKLQITGDDLIAAGVPEGPEIGLRLERSYRMLLADAIEAGREAELRAALEAKI
jgi:tRNA nucleotidyltransferase (CCA-adding enzyme)